MLCILFTLGLIAGGGSSAANAADVQTDYYDNDVLSCEDIKEQFPDDHPAVEQCDYFAQLRNSLAAGAVSANSYA